MKNGFSLIELLVVIAIAGTLSVVAYESIVTFQYQSQVEAASIDLFSTLKDAQSRSKSGQLYGTESVGVFTDTGLPTYRVVLSGNTITLSQIVTYKSPAPVVTPTPEDHTTKDTNVTFLPSSFTITFDRMTGLPNPNVDTVIEISRGSNVVKRIVTVSKNGLISLK